MSFFVAFDVVAVKTTVDTSLEMREYISPKFHTTVEKEWTLDWTSKKGPTVKNTLVQFEFDFYFSIH